MRRGEVFPTLLAEGHVRLEAGGVHVLLVDAVQEVTRGAESAAVEEGHGSSGSVWEERGTVEERAVSDVPIRSVRVPPEKVIFSRNL